MTSLGSIHRITAGILAASAVALAGLTIELAQAHADHETASTRPAAPSTPVSMSTPVQSPRAAPPATNPRMVPEPTVEPAPTTVADPVEPETETRRQQVVNEPQAPAWTPTPRLDSTEAPAQTTTAAS
jgi:hypothetical protein